MKTLAILACLFLASCSTTARRPLCRHIVLSQYAAFVDAGYEAEIWHMENRNPAQAGGFKYHAAVRIKKGGQWQWVQQPQIFFTTTTKRPQGTKLLKKLEFGQVAGWTKQKEKGKQAIGVLEE